MTALELKKEIEQNTSILIVDVRESFELDFCALKFAIHIPMALIPERINSLPTDKDIVIMCHHGIRSAQVVQFLRLNGFERTFNLEGGIHSWATDVDKQMVRY